MIDFRQSFNNSNVWWAITEEEPEACPSCGGQIQYLGIAKDYNTEYSARMYQCVACNAWMDCLEVRNEDSETKTADV